MKKLCILIFVFLFTAFLGVNGQSAKQSYKAGEEFLEKEKYQDAIDQYTKAIQTDPKYTNAYVQRGMAYSLLKKYKEAGEDFERAIVFEPKEPEFYRNAAEMHFKQGADSLAFDRVNKALYYKSTYLEAIQLKVQILIDLKRFGEAAKESATALKYKESPENLYYSGIVHDLLGLYPEAEKFFTKAISKGDKYKEAYVKLADLQRRLKKYPQSLVNCQKAIEIDPKYADAYLVRSQSYIDQVKYSDAINDMSTLILMDPENTSYFFQRGIMYQAFAQHPAAISDFNKVISLDPNNSMAYYKRASSNEQIMKFEDAIKDYEMLAKLSKYDIKAQEMLAEAQKRLFELKREANKPVVSIADPVEKADKVLTVPKDLKVLPITGNIKDQSNLKSLIVNNFAVPFELKDGKYEFLASVNLANADKLTIQATDVYDNTENAVYQIKKTEVDPPVVRVIAPYASDNNVIYLDTNEPQIYVEGTIVDESLIKSININGVQASYVPTDLNPTFQAYINVANKDQFTIKTTDENDNMSEAVFTLNREGAEIAAGNPMGKTWVVFVENSKYENFASLEGPGKDVSMMKTALAKYSIHNFIHKKDMTKQEMEKFFAIDLRDLLRSNRVNSLLLWYAGHGKYVNETGYWVPVDAKRDDEFTYFNISALKASMQSYPKEVTHELVITDACESGPSFYQAMRGGSEIKPCTDWSATRLKSSQVFSSAGYELAVDNSQFTKTFANVLANSPDACTPIESVVQKVSSAAAKSNQQKPQFGKIAGLEDENGTFFFITK